MYETGDLVIYGNQSVCRIVNVGVIEMGKSISEKEYYTLVPIFVDGRTYAPVDTKMNMRPLITIEEVNRLMNTISSIQAMNLGDLTKRETTDYYRNVVKDYSCDELIQFICNMDAKEETRELTGKKLDQTDERYKREAKDLLYQEFAVVLGVTKDDVIEHMRLM